MQFPSVAHLTSVHPRNDNRIFARMCRSLVSAGYRTHLVVADGLGDDRDHGVLISDVGRAVGGRAARIRELPTKVFHRALDLKPRICHLHDPELIPIGKKLRRAGCKVVFDSHEDVPMDILTKDYIPALLRGVVSRSYALYERIQCRNFDGVVAATPFIRDRFLQINPNTVDVCNYPALRDWPEVPDWSLRRDEVAYVGGIAEIRGVRQMVDAIYNLKDVRLNLAGRFNDDRLYREMLAHPGWSLVNDLGFLDSKQVLGTLNRSKAGLVVLHPVRSYIDAQPVKMFEYMAAGIPVIASDFPLWREIIERNDCGICVAPNDPEAIAQAIRRIVDEPETARRMGENGRRAVVDRYNWASEEKKLITLYEGLAS